MRFKIALAVAAAIVPAVAAQAQEFSRQGDTYVYTAARESNGAVHLVGHVARSNAPFDLVVRNRHVAGTMNGSRVEFTVPAETARSLDAEIAGATQTAALN